MILLNQFSWGLKTVPAIVSWCLVGTGEAKGGGSRSSEVIAETKVLRENAIDREYRALQSIEESEVEMKRIGTVIFGRQLLCER